jgi:hypothetical protein
MGNPADEKHYFDKLRELLATPGLRQRILFGTDAWLLRMDMADVVFWNYYRQHAGDLFDVIAGSAPRAFLGYPEKPGDPMRANLQRYVEHMRTHRGTVGAPPAPWLQEAVAQPFEVTRDAADWGPQRTAARLVYQGLGNRMSDAQKRKGYRVNRTLPLRELDYYRPHDPNYDVICEDVARKLLQFARQAGNYRAAYDDTSAVKVFTDLFRKAEKRLVDVAVQLDSVLDLDKAIA